ncbi:MAG: pyridoxamine 5-phosphate oxidase [Clostridia bacterium]|nr:pyridoxamine 5-phosphate oxidase [Clostridia bacterium]
MRDVLKIASDLVERSKNAMVSSMDDDGYPNMKIMFNAREREGIKVFYFTTNTSSLRAKQFLENPKASLYFHDGRFFKGLMLKGKMEVLHDQEIKNLIWRDGDTMYYKEGVTDPDYCVLRFVSESGRLYQNFSSTDFVVA